MAFFIYILRNTVNGKIYVGQTDDINRRKREHRASDRYASKRSPLYCAIKKYGFDKFEMIPIEEWNTEEEVDTAEMFWIEFFRSNRNVYGTEYGYNLTAGGRVNRNFKWSDEKKKEQSIRKKKFYVEHPEALERLSLLQVGKRPSNAKFDNNQVVEMRKEFLTCKFSFEQLAKKYEIAPTTLIYIVKNLTYKDENYHIPNEVLMHYKPGGRLSILEVAEMRKNI